MLRNKSRRTRRRDVNAKAVQGLKEESLINDVAKLMIMKFADLTKVRSLLFFGRIENKVIHINKYELDISKGSARVTKTKWHKKKFEKDKLRDDGGFLNVIRIDSKIHFLRNEINLRSPREFRGMDDTCFPTNEEFISEMNYFGKN